MMGLEVDYVQKYVNSDWVQNVADLGITADDYANSYQYNLDLGSDMDGNVRALFWRQLLDAMRSVQIWLRNILEQPILQSLLRSSKTWIPSLRPQEK